jgi:hypothetical protein
MPGYCGLPSGAPCPPLPCPPPSTRIDHDSSVSLAYSTRRPSRVVAGVFLLVFHVVAIELLLTLKSSRDRPSDDMVTLFFSALPKKAWQPPMPARRQEPRRPVKPVTVVAPTQAPVQEPAQPIHDSSAPITESGSGATPSASPASGAIAGHPPGLNLAIPKEFFTRPPPLTAGQEAMLDPRSNRLVLTKREQIDIDFGAIECIAWQREPDGTIYRGPGHFKRVQDVGTNPFTFHARGREDRHEECVK